jgi:hypothetical protein
MNTALKDFAKRNSLTASQIYLPCLLSVLQGVKKWETAW